MAISLRDRLRMRRKLRVKLRTQKDKGKLRLTVFKSAKHICAQVIDDLQQKTVLSESTLSKEFRDTRKSGGNVDAARWVGKSIGEKAVKQGIKEVYYDRNGFIYHGRVKALAEAVREAGVKF